MKFISSNPKTNLISRLFNKLENSLPSINQTPTATSRHCTIFLTDETVFSLKGERFQRIKWCLIILTSVKKRRILQHGHKKLSRFAGGAGADRTETCLYFGRPDSCDYSGRINIKSGTTINNRSPASGNSESERGLGLRERGVWEHLPAGRQVGGAAAPHRPPQKMPATRAPLIVN